MELIEFFFGIIITIAGVITVEIFIQIYSKKHNQNRLIHSLYHEIINNLALIQVNKGLQSEGGVYRYFPFRNIAHHQFMLGFMINEKTSKDFLDNMFKAYALIDSHNRILEKEIQIGKKIHNKLYDDLGSYLEKAWLELQKQIKSNEV